MQLLVKMWRSQRARIFTKDHIFGLLQFGEEYGWEQTLGNIVASLKIGFRI